MDAIVLKNISKKYNLSNSRPLLIKSFLSNKKQEKWALKNISLNIKKGETIGIIGENGSGKSTLLKIISGITTPTSGSVMINGKVASLIELGAGFHPDLTGKENVYLNATLLGLSKKEIEKKYKEIEDFADIGEYINQPIRTYSSGMVVRLGFSVAIHLDPDILLIDEVFAVGDEEFQRKCLEKIAQLKHEHKTLFIVSHNLSLIQNICESAICVENGKIKEHGKSETVVKKYVSSVNNDKKKSHTSKNYLLNDNKKISIKEIKFLGKSGKEQEIFSPGEIIKIRILYKNISLQTHASFGIVIYSESGERLFGISSKPILMSKPYGESSLVISHNPISNGFLYFTFAISSIDGLTNYDWVEKTYSIRIGSKNSKNNVLPFQTIWK